MLKRVQKLFRDIFGLYSFDIALARCFQVKHPNAADELKYIMIVDMGYLNTTVAIVSQDGSVD